LGCLHDSCLEPFADQAQDALISDPVLDKLLHPPVVDGVEEPTDVRVQHPVLRFATQSHHQGIKRLMEASPRPEPVEEAEEVGLIHSIEQLNDRAQKVFALHGGDAERAILADRIGDGKPPAKHLPSPTLSISKGTVRDSYGLPGPHRPRTMKPQKRMLIQQTPPRGR
jgi:hypothetical protein